MTENLFFATLQYLVSTIRHKAYVFYAGVFIVGNIPIWRLLIHDWSKFLPIEFINYARFYKIKDGRNSQPAFIKAWMHHQKHNKHHPEYWITHGVFDWANGSIEMPETYIREWVADLLGASREYTKSWDMEEWIRVNISRWNYCHVNTLDGYREVLNEIGIPVVFLDHAKELYLE